MGCDIHLGVERFTGTEWVPVEGLLPTSWGERTDDSHPKYWADNRNYDTFALLAGVRNGVGFAGAKRCEPVVPCFPDRGIPEDTSFENTGESWLGGDHSHTYFSYQESLSIPWKREVLHHAIVPIAVYAEWKNSGADAPKEWSIGGSMDVISEEKAGVMIADGEVSDSRHRAPWVQCQFTTTPLSNCGMRMWLICSDFQSVVAEHGAENVRICVSFDS